jgi:redox-sensitive bicupin YhaK (pirin superfamily)
MPLKAQSKANSANTAKLARQVELLDTQSSDIVAQLNKLAAAYNRRKTRTAALSVHLTSRERAFLLVGVSVAALLAYIEGAFEGSADRTKKIHIKALSVKDVDTCLIARARRHQITDAEREEQARIFVYGNVIHNPALTRGNFDRAAEIAKDRQSRYYDSSTRERLELK